MSLESSFNGLSLVIVINTYLQMVGILLKHIVTFG